MTLFYIITISVITILSVFFVYLGKYVKQINDSVESSKDSSTSTKEPYLMFSDMKRPGFFRRIYLYWKFEWRYIPRDIQIGFKNLFQWFHIIWSDRNWDHTYLLQMMKFKIEKMADYHESRQFYVGWENNVKWMRTCGKLIDRMIDSTYEGELHKYYDIEVWCVPEDDTDEFVGLDMKTTRENLDDYFKLYPLQIPIAEQKFSELKKYDVDYDNADDRKLLGMLLAQHNQQRCQTLLFKILNENLQKWWD